MPLMPIQYVDMPYYTYEIRREMRVRESRHTFMVWDQKHFDVETGKYCLDKLKSIQSYSWDDVIEDYASCHTRYMAPITTQSHKQLNQERSKTYNFPRFIPKDDDFDDEPIIEPKKQVNDILVKKSSIMPAHEYAKILADAEHRAAKQQMIYLGGSEHGKPVTNVIRNKWNTK